MKKIVFLSLVALCLPWTLAAQLILMPIINMTKRLLISS